MGVEEKSGYVVERMGESLFFGFVIHFAAPAAAVKRTGENGRF